MKHPLFGCALGLVVAFAAGCASSGNQPYLASTMKRSNSYALAVTVNGGLQPTPMQWAAIQSKFADEFAWRGWVLVTDLALADYIVRVDFTPDPIDPENTGTVAVLGIRNNPRNVLASMTTVSRYPTSFGYSGTFQNALWAPSYSNMYYGWNDSYYDGYSYSSPTLNPVKPPPLVTTHPPYRHHQPGEPVYCPPGTTDRHHDRTRPPSFLPGDFAAAQPPSTAPIPTLASNDRSHRWFDSHRSSDGTSTRTDSGSSGSSASSGITYSRGGSNSTSSDRTYARTDSNGTRDWSSWRDRNSRSDSTASDSTSSRPDSSTSSWRDRSSSDSSSWRDRGSQSGSTYSRSDSGYSRSGSDSSSSSHGSWAGRSDSGSSYSRPSSDASSSHGSWTRSDSGSSHSSGSSSSSYSGSSSSSSSSGSSSSGGSSSSSSSGGSSSVTGSVSSRGAQSN